MPPTNRSAPNLVTIYALEAGVDRRHDARVVVYVGLTSRPKKRRLEHLSTACQRKKPLLWRHIQKWRSEGLFIRWTELEQCEPRYALRRELEWMARFLEDGHQLANHGPWNLKDPLFLQMDEEPRPE